MPERKIILDLCGGTGSWSEPYRAAGYDVRLVTLPDSDVRLMQKPDYPVHGILAAPPCDHFANSGARWWAGKGTQALLDGLSVVDACLRLVWVCKPSWWALENPNGRLVHYLGKPVTRFDPCDYGDPWTKRTCLWGHFTPPEPNPVAPTEGSKMHRMSSSNKEGRSKTPPGFAHAFFDANP